MAPGPRWIVRVTPEPETLGGAVRRLREARGLLQKEMAELLGISQNAVSAYETGSRPVPDQVVRRYALALDTPATELFDIALGHERWLKVTYGAPEEGWIVPDESGEVVRRFPTIERLATALRAVLSAHEGWTADQVESAVHGFLNHEDQSDADSGTIG